ncbi:MAG: hypothetical protein HYS81_01570 [Candidatus Aenigmatarchaeota archaeon]|nr:MAG: hypothetical protein HYS81_01570 [Candidatus Aenigmarchaeota archaeon]
MAKDDARKPTRTKDVIFHFDRGAVRGGFGNMVSALPPELRDGHTPLLVDRSGFGAYVGSYRLPAALVVETREKAAGLEPLFAPNGIGLYYLDSKGNIVCYSKASARPEETKERKRVLGLF